MTLAACAEMVRASDPDRFAATTAAPPEARARLWPLYAFNLEIARAAWVSPEPMICRMRLQWWIDTVLAMPEAPAKAHEVAAPLHALVRETGLPVALLAGMAEAREWDTGREPFAGRAGFDAYLDATAGNLMWAAARALSAPPSAETAVRDFAFASGLANWFCATAELASRGRQPLPDASPDGIAALGRDGLGRLARARAARSAIPREAAPALFPGWQARGLLVQATREPDRVLSGRLGLSEFRKRGGLLLRAVTGRF
jgi:phytoene/squalene synthetase